MKQVILILCLIVFTGSAFADEWVNGYYRKDGTYVQGYYRSSPNNNPYDNYSYPGNTNPYTGKTAPGNPNTYIERYQNRQTPNYNQQQKTPNYEYRNPYQNQDDSENDHGNE
jgi:hypothetical protein